MIESLDGSAGRLPAPHDYEDVDERDVGKSAIGRYTCSTCGRLLPNAGSLTNHERVFRCGGAQQERSGGQMPAQPLLVRGYRHNGQGGPCRSAWGASSSSDKRAASEASDKESQSRRRWVHGGL